MVPVIGVDKEKCLNCHRCISVCPVKFCIDGSGDTVDVIHSRCIGCGSCIDVCTHGARFVIDDMTDFIDAAKQGEPLVAVIAPSAAVTFDGNMKKLNGFLKSLGVSAFFDVSFGAELTVKSYLDYITKEKPPTVISQPCPAIVTYIEMYQPQLIPLLAPADSPMMHSLKMIREFFPQYKDHKSVIISPCISKKREFSETQIGNYNVTFLSIDKYLTDENLILEKFPVVDYDSPLPERAVLFSTPGGLQETLRRENPEAALNTRKIEGVQQVYPYFDSLENPENIANMPVLIDCLNCEKGCNGGTGTAFRESSIEKMEGTVQIRADKHQQIHQSHKKRGLKKLRASINKYWKEGLYERTYVNRQDAASVLIPNDADLVRIFQLMMKESENEHYNCSACGYNSCQQMAVAIFNGLNKPENCYHFQLAFMKKIRKSSSVASVELNNYIQTSIDRLDTTGFVVTELLQKAEDQSIAIEQSSSSIIEMLSSIQMMADMTERQKESVHVLIDDSRMGANTLSHSLQSIRNMIKNIEGIADLNETIHEIARETSILSMNAAIEAAHSGDAGKGFSVVSDNIRNVAEMTAEHANGIADELKSILLEAKETSTISARTYQEMDQLLGKTNEMALGYQQLFIAMEEISGGGHQIEQALNELNHSSAQFHQFCLDMNGMFDDMKIVFRKISDNSRDNLDIMQARF